MKVVRGITIDGKESKLLGMVSGGVQAYYSETEHGDEGRIYFVNTKDEVLSYIDIDTGMSQGCGFIASVAFNQVL